jgi:hypothetical protein
MRMPGIRGNSATLNRNPAAMLVGGFALEVKAKLQ